MKLKYLAQVVGASTWNHGDPEETIRPSSLPTRPNGVISPARSEHDELMREVRPGDVLLHIKSGRVALARAAGWTTLEVQVLSWKTAPVEGILRHAAGELDLERLSWSLWAQLQVQRPGAHNLASPSLSALLDHPVTSSSLDEQRAQLRALDARAAQDDQLRELEERRRHLATEWLREAGQ